MYFGLQPIFGTTFEIRIASLQRTKSLFSMCLGSIVMQCMGMYVHSATLMLIVLWCKSYAYTHSRSVFLCHPAVYQPPTFKELQCLRDIHGNGINIIQMIAPHYLEFGVYLLRDTRRLFIIHTIERDHPMNPEEITLRILQRWMEGMGRGPITWATLIDVLREINHERLAFEIKKALYEVD